jgi:hypothetical protein
LVRCEDAGDDSIVPDDAAPNVVELRTAPAAPEARIAQLEQIIHDLRRARFGQSIERVDPGQLALTAGAAPPPPPVNGDGGVAPERKPASERRRNCGALPAHLERVEEVIDIADRGCRGCPRRLSEPDAQARRGRRFAVSPASCRSPRRHG